MIPLKKLPKNVRDLGKLIVAKGLKKLPKVQKIAQSGHTACDSKDYSVKMKLGSGYGFVGRAVASYSRGPQFECSHRGKNL